MLRPAGSSSSVHATPARIPVPRSADLDVAAVDRPGRRDPSRRRLAKVGVVALPGLRVGRHAAELVHPGTGLAVVLDREAMDLADWNLRIRIAGLRHNAAELGGLPVGEDVQAVDAHVYHEVAVVEVEL